MVTVYVAFVYVHGYGRVCVQKISSGVLQVNIQVKGFILEVLKLSLCLQLLLLLLS
jgi:hypothetical protein